MSLNNLFGRNKRNAMKPAPTHLWNPPFCGDMDLLIRKDGVWVHEGKPIKRRELVKLFASILCVDSDGDYYLVSPQEKVRIRVEKYPFVIQEMDVVGEGRYQSIYFTTNVGEKFPQEARKIHYDKKTSKGIYGSATNEETKELLEEGIEVSTVPWVKKNEN